MNPTNQTTFHPVMQGRHFGGFAAVILLVLGAANFATAATTPYFQDFQGIAASGPVPDFAASVNGTAASSTWNVVLNGANHLYENVLSGAASSKGFSTMQFPALGTAVPANNFEISTVVHGVSLNSASTINYTVGIVFLGNVDVQSGTVDNLYVADFNLSSAGSGANSGRMRIVEWANTTTAAVFPSATQTSQPQVPNFSLSKSYLLDVKGTYDVSGNLTAVFTVSDVANASDMNSYTFTDGPAGGNTSTVPRTGSYFGLYTSMGAGAGNSMTVDFDNFTVVPEPSSLALTALGALSLAGLRRRILR